MLKQPSTTTNRFKSNKNTLLNSSNRWSSLKNKLRVKIDEDTFNLDQFNNKGVKKSYDLNKEQFKKKLQKLTQFMSELESDVITITNQNPSRLFPSYYYTTEFSQVNSATLKVDNSSLGSPLKR